MITALSPSSSAAARGTAVLLVEDNVLVSLSTVEMLKDLGYAVHRTANGKSALTELDEHADIAVMIADIGLPDMNGHQLAARARDRHPGLRVLFITGYDAPVAGRTPADAITEYLVKPYQPAELGHALRRLLAG